MIPESNALQHKKIYYRLIALWVICEAFAGGILHGIKIPFTGLIISSLAVMCIILIAWHVPSKNAIIKATIIVAVFKLMLSPQTPPTAYIAVFFQGLVGQLLFLHKRFFKLSATILGTLALTESAIQRILVLLIVYGTDFWKAVDIYIQKLLNERTTGFSLIIAVAYIFIHAVTGIFVGRYAANLAMRSEKWSLEYPELIINLEKKANDIQLPTKKGKKIKWLFTFLWIVLIALLIESWFYPGTAIIKTNTILAVMVRSALILLSWYMILAPLTSFFINKILKNQRLKKEHEINAVMELLPKTKQVFVSSWQVSSKERGLNRLQFFLKILLINIIAEESTS